MEKTPPGGTITVSRTETKKQTVKKLFGNKNVKQTDKLSNHMILVETGPCSRNVDIPYHDTSHLSSGNTLLHEMYAGMYLMRMTLFRVNKKPP